MQLNTRIVLQRVNQLGPFVEFTTNNSPWCRVFHYILVWKHIRPLDSVLLAVVHRRWAQGEGPVAGEAVERSEHAVRHVI